ncbi:MAG TPA: hypothetical protein VEL70_04960, partial [Candidatus Acidoferrum sp.]|nr:hypothetical protein [Candidatus Acidoferrum sp.]
SIGIIVHVMFRAYWIHKTAFLPFKFQLTKDRLLFNHYYSLLIKSIQKLILPVLLFFVSGAISFEKATDLSSACKD